MATADAETPTDAVTYVAHLVEVTGFLWKDSPDNIPPICHTCPKYQNGGIPCIGILVLLSNLPPLVNEASVTSWQKGKGGSGLMRPEIFKSRWRVDRDPTRYLERYSPPAPPPRRILHNHADLRPVEAVLPTDISDKFEINMKRIENLDELPKQRALRAVSALMQQMDYICGKHELDVLLVRTCQVLSFFSIIHLISFCTISFMVFHRAVVSGEHRRLIFAVEHQQYQKHELRNTLMHHLRTLQLELRRVVHSREMPPFEGLQAFATRQTKRKHGIVNHATLMSPTPPIVLGSIEPAKNIHKIL